MKPEEITDLLTARFGLALETPTPESWQVEMNSVRLLVLLSEDHTWLRMLIPILPATEAEPFLEQLLTANFDATQETRYALHQGVLWGVFQHSLNSLQPDDFMQAVNRLVALVERGLSESFTQLVETRIVQIIAAAKERGQSLQSTLQTLERFYEEGLLGDLEQGSESREAVLAAWRYQLERFWSQV